MNKIKKSSFIVAGALLTLLLVLVWQRGALTEVWGYIAAAAGQRPGNFSISTLTVSCSGNLPVVNASWTRSENAIRYQLERKYPWANTWEVTGETTALTLDDATWSTGYGTGLYAYRVRALSSLSSRASTARTIDIRTCLGTVVVPSPATTTLPLATTTPTPTPLSTPAPVPAPSTTPTSTPSLQSASLGAFTLGKPTVVCSGGIPNVSLSWTPSSGADRYAVQRKVASDTSAIGFSGSVLGSITATSAIDKQFSSSYGRTWHSYRIVARFGTTLESYSNAMALVLPECAIATTTAAIQASSTSPITSAPASTTSLKFPSWMSWGASVGWQSTKMDEFETLVGKAPQMESIFSHWGNDTFPLQYAPRIRDKGRVMVLFWEALDYNRDPMSQPEYGFDAVNNGSLDAFIVKYAQDAKAYGGPVILVPYSEFNGNWYPWGITVGSNTPAKFIAAWSRIYGIFKAQGATNVKFAWVPNNDSVPDIAANDFALAWPGDAVVDYVGLDGFNSAFAWETFDQMMNTEIGRLKKYNKPIYILSIAAAQHPKKAEWITDAFTVQLYKHPEVKGWIWFNENKEEDWRVNSSTTSLAAFRSILP